MQKNISNKFVLGLFIALFLLNHLLSYSAVTYDMAADMPKMCFTHWRFIMIT